MKSILVIDTPSSCSECILEHNEDNKYYGCKITGLSDVYINRNIQHHPNCPLISIDIDEFEKAHNKLSLGSISYISTIEYNKAYNTIQSIIVKLKGDN